MTRNDPILAYAARIPSGCVVPQTRSHFGTESSMFSRSMDSPAGSQGEHICEQEPVQRFAQKPTPSKVALGLPIVSIRRSWSIQCAVPMMCFNIMGSMQSLHVRAWLFWGFPLYTDRGSNSQQAKQQASATGDNEWPLKIRTGVYPQ